MYKHTLIATGGCDQGIDLGLALVKALEPRPTSLQFSSRAPKAT
jgi:hypothetical protein